MNKANYEFDTENGAMNLRNEAMEVSTSSMHNKSTDWTVYKGTCFCRTWNVFRYFYKLLFDSI